MSRRPSASCFPCLPSASRASGSVRRCRRSSRPTSRTIWSRTSASRPRARSRMTLQRCLPDRADRKRHENGRRDDRVPTAVCIGCRGMVGAGAAPCSATRWYAAPWEQCATVGNRTWHTLSRGSVPSGPVIRSPVPAPAFPVSRSLRKVAQPDSSSPLFHGAKEDKGSHRDTCRGSEGRTGRGGWTRWRARWDGHRRVRS